MCSAAVLPFDALLTTSISGVVAIRATGARSVIGSYAIAGFNSFATVSWLLFMTPIVCMSVALATRAAAMVPEAPALFSTNTGVPRTAESDGAMARAERSWTEPGGKPITRRTGWLGHA